MKLTLFARLPNGDAAPIFGFARLARLVEASAVERFELNVDGCVAAATDHRMRGQGPPVCNALRKQLKRTGRRRVEGDGLDDRVEH